MFLSSLTNTSGSLEEREMLWEHEPKASVSTAFSSSPNLSRVFVQLDRNKEYMFSASFRKHHDENKENNLLTLIRKHHDEPQFGKTPRQEKGKQLVNFVYQNVNSLCSRHHYVNSAC